MADSNDVVAYLRERDRRRRRILTWTLAALAAAGLIGGLAAKANADAARHDCEVMEYVDGRTC